jgi:hypothetical protein
MEDEKTTQEEIEQAYEPGTMAREFIDHMFELFSDHTERMTKKLADIELHRKEASERINNGISNHQPIWENSDECINRTVRQNAYA